MQKGDKNKRRNLKHLNLELSLHVTQFQSQIVVTVEIIITTREILPDYPEILKLMIIDRH